MAYSRNKSKQEQGQSWEGVKRIRAHVMPGSPLPGYHPNGARIRNLGYSRFPFRLPSLNASPTCSVDDLSMNDDPILNNATAPLYSLQNDSGAGIGSGSGSGGGSGFGSGTWRSKKDSPGSYRKTLEQLATLRKQRPMLGSTSDYFSLTSSMCSDDGDYCPFDFENGDEDFGFGSDWPISNADMEELRSVAEKVLQGHQGSCDEVRIKADLLDNICQQTRELERRNEELRQELEQLHFDTKKFVEKNGNNNDEQGVGKRGLEEWRDEDFDIVFDDNETEI